MASNVDTTPVPPIRPTFATGSRNLTRFDTVRPGPNGRTVTQRPAPGTAIEWTGEHANKSTFLKPAPRGRLSRLLVACSMVLGAGTVAALTTGALTTVPPAGATERGVHPLCGQ